MTMNTVEKIVLVRLYGKLGALFGREHRLSVSSVREAIRALCIMLPGFERWLDTSEGRGVTYSVFNGSRNITAEELRLNGVWICPYISRHLLSLNPLLARCRRYSRGER